MKRLLIVLVAVITTLYFFVMPSMAEFRYAKLPGKDEKISVIKHEEKAPSRDKNKKYQFKAATKNYHRKQI